MLKKVEQIEAVLKAANMSVAIVADVDGLYIGTQLFRSLLTRLKDK